MADAGLFFSFGETYPGREEQGVRLWHEANAYYTSLLEARRIGRFEPFVLGANGGGLRGFRIIGGTQSRSVLCASMTSSSATSCARNCAARMSL